jgi:microcystin-dependent protein
MDGKIGDIKLFIGQDIPDNWAICEGQILPIAQNIELFSSLQGFLFGGDGKSTFGLPDLRCSIPPYSGFVNFIICISEATTSEESSPEEEGSGE